MPRYRFSWENLSPTLLSALCDTLGLKSDVPADALRASYGARPKPEFVRDAWPVLRDSWLVDDAASRAPVLDQLRKARLGSADAPVGTQGEQMTYLRSCHNQLSLREIVLAQLLAVGEASTSPASAQEAGPIGSSATPQPSAWSVHDLDYIDDPELKHRVLSPKPLGADDYARLVAAARRAQGAGKQTRPIESSQTPPMAAPDVSALLNTDSPSSKPGSPQAPRPIQPTDTPSSAPAAPHHAGGHGAMEEVSGRENTDAGAATDLAPILLDHVFTAMSIDAQWGQREARGFEWWACRLRQRVWADPVRQSRGDVITRFHAETDYIRDVPDQDQTYEVLAAVNGLADLSTFYFDPAERVIRSHTAMYFHPEIRWMEQLLKTAAALQDADAHASAQQLSKILGGEPDISEHPTSGERPDQDEMLNIAASMQADMAPSAFTEEVFNTVLTMQPRPWVLATGGGAGLTAEFPFYDDVPAAMRVMMAPGSKQGNTTALLMASGTERNPRVGSGLLLRLCLPISIEAAAARRLANDLNVAESREWTECHLLGSWCTRDTALWFVGFVPSLVAIGLQPQQRAVLMFNLIMSMRIRTNWAKAYLSARNIIPT